MTFTFQNDYLSIRSGSGPLEPHADPASLLSSLHGARGTDDERNAILAELVTAAQHAGPAAETASILLHLALWPGLDAVRGRLIRHFRHHPENLTEEITSRFAIGVRKLDLARVNRIAATLIRNTERDIRRALKVAWADAGAEAEIEIRQFYWPDRQPSSLGLSDEVTTPAAIGLLRDRLEPIIGADTDLVIAIAVCGDDQRLATAALGLDYETGRKRYLRAIARLRRMLSE